MIDIHELIGRINAMRASEERYDRCQNYFAYCSESSDVDASCRKAMANWCFQVADTLSFSHETVGLAMSFFDRYLSSRRGKSQEALDSRNMFHLAAIACFYTAVKTYEPVKLGVHLVTKMCRDFYSADDIIAMESDILFALEWCVSGPTPMDFVRHLIELLPSFESNSFLLEDTEKYMDQTITDVYFSFFKPSVVGASCLISSLTRTNSLCPNDLESVLGTLSQIIDLTDVMELQKRLNEDDTPSQAASQETDLGHCVIRTTSSPVCVAEGG